jgi:hypothetical protein
VTLNGLRVIHLRQYFAEALTDPRYSILRMLLWKMFVIDEFNLFAIQVVNVFVATGALETTQVLLGHHTIINFLTLLILNNVIQVFRLFVKLLKLLLYFRFITKLG